MLNRWLMTLGAMLVAFYVDPALAQSVPPANPGLLANCDPTGDLVSTIEGLFRSVFNLASALGMIAGAIAAVLAYIGVLDKFFVKYIIFITAIVVLIPQIVEIVFASSTPTFAQAVC